MLWAYDGVGKGYSSASVRDGRIYGYGKSGKMGLLAPNPDSPPKPAGVFPIRKGAGQHWAHPSIADGVLYVRHGPVLMAFDIGK